MHTNHLDRAQILFARLKDETHGAQVDETRARVLLSEDRVVEAEKAKKITPTIHALLRSENHVPADEIREISNMVPDFPARYVEDYFKDRAARRARINLLTVSTVFLFFAVGIAIVISAISGRPVGQAITTLAVPLLSVIGSAIIGFKNRK